VHSGRPIDPKEARLLEEKNPLKRLGMALGPGLITGASDDDPSGIGTYAQAGAQHGFATLWMIPAMLPMVTAVQYSQDRPGDRPRPGRRAVSSSG